MNAGQSLTSGQVSGIVHLVASSIPKLDAGNVTVVDNNGNVLAAPGVGITAAAAPTPTQGYEGEPGRDDQTAARSVVGVGHANVQVYADVDTTRRRPPASRGDRPQGQGHLRHHLVERPRTEQYGAGTTSAPAGVLGTTATSTGSNTTTNTTGTAAGTGTATGTGGVNGANTGTSSTTTNGNGGYTKTTKDEQYALGKIGHHDAGPGQLNPLHVAVLVDSAAKPNIATITKLANTAGGINAKRGDSLTVVQMPFSKTSATRPPRPRQRCGKGKVRRSATTGLIRLVVAMLGVLAMVVLLLRSTKRERREDIVGPLERLGRQLALPSGSSTARGMPSPRTQAAAGELAAPHRGRP